MKQIERQIAELRKLVVLGDSGDPHPVTLQAADTMHALLDYYHAAEQHIQYKEGACGLGPYAQAEYERAKNKLTEVVGDERD